MIQKRCANCGADFDCHAKDTDTLCWCAELPAIMPMDSSKGCHCSFCLKQIIIERIQQTLENISIEEKLELAAPYSIQVSLIEDIDYIQENGNYVFSSWYHLKRGNCCGNGCRNCPYDSVSPAECL